MPAAAPPTTSRVPTGAGPDEGRVVRPRRSLPGSRAVVGALLVVLAAVGTFATYLRATSPPTTTWLVVTEELRPGQVLSTDDVGASLAAVAIELPVAQQARVLPAAAADGLAGAIVQSPLAVGDLVLRSSVAAPVSDDVGVSLSVAVPEARALGGRVGAGEVVDLLATFDEVTTVVARGVRVADVAGGSDGVGGGSRVVTVLVPDLATAEVVLNAADNGLLALARGADPAERTGPGTRAGAQGPVPLRSEDTAPVGGPADG